MRAVQPTGQDQARAQRSNRVACTTRACNRMLAFVFSMPYWRTAAVTGIELVTIGADTTHARFPAIAPLEPGVLLPGSRAVSVPVTDRTRIQEPAAPVLPSAAAIARLNPLGGQDVAIAGGFWADRLRVNRERTLPHVFDQLVEFGNLVNMRLAAGASGQYQAIGVMFDGPFPFLDSDVYKWLEGVAWELSRAPDADVARMADEAIEAIAAAQRDDGYLNTFVQVVAPGRRVQGPPVRPRAVLRRAPDPGGDRVAPRAARRPPARRSPARPPTRSTPPSGRRARRASTGTPRSRWPSSSSTGRPARRATSSSPPAFERRGHGLLGSGRFGSPYWQDHLPVREAPGVAGHVVRQLYLDAGAVDVATETGDTELLDAVHRRWRDMVATRSYLTGGLGSRHEHEGFGDPYELPPDRAYAETCAAIASVMLAWRLLLATGDPDCADVIERTIYNGVLSGVSADGTRFFYVNPLQRRTHRVAADRRRRRAGALVRLRVLPAEPRADLRELAAIPRDDGPRRGPGPPVRDGRDPRRDPCRRRAARGRDRLPVGRPRAADDPRGHPTARGRSPCGSRPGAIGGRRLGGDVGRLARTVAAGPDQGGRPRRQLHAVVARRRRGRARPRHAGPPHRARTPRGREPGLPARSSAARSSTASSPPICPRASSSRTLPSRRPPARSRCRGRTSGTASSAWPRRPRSPGRVP